MRTDCIGGLNPVTGVSPHRTGIVDTETQAGIRSGDNGGRDWSYNTIRQGLLRISGNHQKLKKATNILP